MFKVKRGQISVEYLIVVGFVVFLVISILGVALFYASGIKDRIRINQLNNFANKIISNAEAVFFAGEPSKVTITAHLPEGVTNIVIQEDPPASGQDIILFDIETSSGQSRIAFSSDVPIDDVGSDISNTPGVKRLCITAQQSDVLIVEC